MDAQAPPPTVPPLRENTRENIHFWSFWFTSGVPVVVTNDSQATVPVLIGMETTQDINLWLGCGAAGPAAVIRASRVSESRAASQASQ